MGFICLPFSTPTHSSAHAVRLHYPWCLQQDHKCPPEYKVHLFFLSLLTLEHHAMLLTTSPFLKYPLPLTPGTHTLLIFFLHLWPVLRIFCVPSSSTGSSHVGDIPDSIVCSFFPHGVSLPEHQTLGFSYHSCLQPRPLLWAPDLLIWLLGCVTSSTH